LVRVMAAVAKIAKATITSNKVKPEARLSRVTLDRAASPKAMLEEQRRVKRCFTAAQDDELCSACTRLSRVKLGLIAPNPVFCLKYLDFIDFTQMINLNRSTHFTVF